MWHARIGMTCIRPVQRLCRFCAFWVGHGEWRAPELGPCDIPMAPLCWNEGLWWCWSGLPPLLGTSKTVFSRSNRDLFPFVVRYRTSVGAEVSKHERRGKLADCPSIPQGDGSIPHHARGLRFHGSPVFRGSLLQAQSGAIRRNARLALSLWEGREPRLAGRVGINDVLRCCWSGLPPLLQVWLCADQAFRWN